MKLKYLYLISLLVASLFFTIISNLFISAPLKADGVFQPTKLAIDFYEIGLSSFFFHYLLHVLDGLWK